MNFSGPGYKRKHPFGADKHSKNKMFKSRQNIDNGRKQSTKSNDINKDNPLNKDTPRNIKTDKYKTELSQNKNNIVPTIDDRRQLQPFKGIQKLIELDDIDKNESLDNEKYFIEDDDEVYAKVPEPKSTETVKDIKPSVCGVLSSLMCDYGSADEETEAKDLIDVNVSTTSMNIYTKDVKSVTVDITSEHKTNLVVKDFKGVSDDDSGPEEVKLAKPDKSVVKEVNKTLETANSNIVNKLVRKNKKENYVQKKHIQTRPKPKLPSTLLQKLLHREIRHERNVVLQCIRYIVNNNYLDKT